MPFPSVNVLVVEDHWSSLDVIGSFLENVGCRCKLAPDNYSALRLAAAEDFSLLLTDAQLGNEDGWTLIHALRGRGCLPPFVASMSAGTNRTQTDRSKAEGCNSHLIKPLRRKELEAILSKTERGDGSSLELP